MSQLRSLILVLSVAFAAPAFAERALLAVATNFAETARDLAKDFEAQSGHSVEFAFGATGKIYAQILRGAPFDGFLAADQHRPQLLHEAGLGELPFTYAQGVLVWWPDLESADIKGKIAIANPELAPYGLAAKEVLQHMSLWQDWQDRIVMGENVGQTFAMVATGNAHAGLVALSSVKSARNTMAKTWVEATGHAPIRQDAILLKRGRDNAAASGFFAFLKTEAAREKIRGDGYDFVAND